MCSPEQVLVLNSPMQAIELIGRVLLEPGDKVWLEDPGHASLVSLFQVLHAKVVGVPLDARGLDVAAGRRAAPDAAAVYLHPLTQFPLGVRTDSARRAELLQWADESGAWIIEGNFNDEIAHDGAAPVSFQAMDRSDRVLLMGTLEGIMFPSLRLAYLVVPERLVEVFVAMRGLLGDHTNASLQIAMAAFIDEGHMSNHLRLLRQVSRERRDALRGRLQRAPARLGAVGSDRGGHARLPAPAAGSERHGGDATHPRARRDGDRVVVDLLEPAAVERPGAGIRRLHAERDRAGDARDRARAARHERRRHLRRRSRCRRTGAKAHQAKGEKR